jgi:hypothetical protein
MIDYLETKQTKDGGFGGANRDKHYNQWSLSGVGILGLQTWPRTRPSADQEGHEVPARVPHRRTARLEQELQPLLLVLLHPGLLPAVGGDDWKFYNQQFLPQILSAQQPDGSFKARPSELAAGPTTDAADEIYRQCLCTLQLEVSTATSRSVIAKRNRSSTSRRPFSSGLPGLGALQPPEPAQRLSFH